MKLKKRFVCKECGYTAPSWLGKCPECNSWSSFVEEMIENSFKKTEITEYKLPVKIQEIQNTNDDIYFLEHSSVNSFFGEGIVAGSVILLAGEPGIGKSTFLFFLGKYINRTKKIFYFSGEESVSQIKKRFDRVGAFDSSIFVSNNSDIDSIYEICKKEKPSFLLIDSIQTCYSKSVDSSPGTISQIKKCTQILIDYAKTEGIVIFIVCHVTKSGEIAGPKIMEHMVDVVIYFEGDYKNQFRVLRSRKNRFGNIDEILIFEMENNGLKLIDNPSAYFIENDPEKQFIGKCKSVIMEGKRPMIVDVEVLVVPSSFPNPRRFSEGIELSRLNRIIAIIDKHLNENFSNYDVYFNISGGIKTSDVGLDLAVAAALYSSKNKKWIKNNEIFIGELSLTGGVKKVYKLENRIKEAARFGYDQLYYPDEKKKSFLEILFLKEVIL